MPKPIKPPKALKVLQSRASCGDCTACCTVLPITELNKPGCVTCEQLDEKRPGCSIYASRPKVCKEFECFWLIDQKDSRSVLPAEFRPDLLGVLIMSTQRTAFGHTILAVETLPDGTKDERFRVFIGTLVEAGAIEAMVTIPYGQPDKRKLIQFK